MPLRDAYALLMAISSGREGMAPSTTEHSSMPSVMEWIANVVPFPSMEWTA